MYYEWHDRLPSAVFESGEVGLRRALVSEFDRHLYLHNALGFVPYQIDECGYLVDLDPNHLAEAKDFITNPPIDLEWIERDSPTYRIIKLGAYPAILIENTQASEMTEPIWVLIIKANRLRYFALEVPASPDERKLSSTEGMLCEWTQDRTHLNYGSSPRTEYDFLAKIREILIKG